jgi:hypothetical protein
MADTSSTHVEIDEETAELARRGAETRHLPVEQYLGELVREDQGAVAVRTLFMDGARDVLHNYGDVIDEALGEIAA